jgi:hypothetical protein
MAATVAVPPRAAQRQKAWLSLILRSLQDGTARPRHLRAR